MTTDETRELALAAEFFAAQAASLAPLADTMVARAEAFANTEGGTFGLACCHLAKTARNGNVTPLHGLMPYLRHNNTKGRVALMRFCDAAEAFLSVAT